MPSNLDVRNYMMGMEVPALSIKEKLMIHSVCKRVSFLISTSSDTAQKFIYELFGTDLEPKLYMVNFTLKCINRLNKGLEIGYFNNTHADFLDYLVDVSLVKELTEKGLAVNSNLYNNSVVNTLNELDAMV